MSSPLVVITSDIMIPLYPLIVQNVLYSMQTVEKQHEITLIINRGLGKVSDVEALGRIDNLHR